MAHRTTSIIACVLLACGCSKSPSETHDPLAEFKAVVKLFPSDSYDCYDVSKLQMGKTLVTVEWEQDVRFDVEKTSSLVSPYAATVTYSRTFSAGIGDHLVIVFTVKFAYQDNRWVVQDVTTNPENLWPSYRLCYATENKCWQAALGKFYKSKSA